MTGSKSSQVAAWWIAAVATLVAMAVWTGAGTGGIPAFDREGLTLAHAWRSPWLDTVFPILTWLGSMMVLLPLVVVGGAVFWRRGFRREAGFLVAAVVGASILAQLAKHLALRQRPDLFAALALVASPLSFPSSHAVQVTALAVAAGVLVARFAPGCRRRAMLLLALMVVLVGLSRLYLQVHYPSDVLAGTLVAALWVAGLRVLVFARD
jgi:membrane-associated phospholipid phosphatase